MGEIALKQARLDKDWTLDELADQTERSGYRVSRATLHRAETGVGIPGYDTVIALENTFAVPAGTLFFPGVPVRRKRVRR
jgi:transcriptional regulator with XRE-family HTH domain